MGSARALVLDGPRRLELATFDLPEITDDDALLRVEACGLCGTDHEQFTGALPGGTAFVPGHETVGVVETIGAGATDRLGVRVGDRVAVEVFQSCRACGPCTVGEYRRCESHGIADMYGFIPTSRPPALWGGYARYQYLSRDTMLHAISPGLDPVVATLFNPLGAGIRWAASLPRTSPGDVVAILGCGVRGLCACAAAKQAGAETVLVTGKGERDRTRLSIVRRFGADMTVDVEKQDPMKVLVDSAGTLADIVVDVTAKAPEALPQAVALARAGGTIVLAGTRGNRPTNGFDPDLLVYKELTVHGALGVDAPAYERALELLASGIYPFEEIPRTVSGLEDAPRLLSAMGGEGGPAPLHGVIAPWLDI
jgi:alcohol dehydrogenase